LGKEAMKMIAEKSIAIIFLTAHIRNTWRSPFEEFNPKIRTYSMIPVFDTSLLVPFESPSGVDNNKNFIVLPGLISKKRRDYTSLMAAYDEGVFPNNLTLTLLGPKPGKRQLPMTLLTNLEQRFNLITTKAKLHFLPFFETISRSRGIFLGIPEGVMKGKGSYFHDNSSGNIALAISLGVPMIGDIRLRQFVPEVKCCALIYNQTNPSSTKRAAERGAISIYLPVRHKLMERDDRTGSMRMKNLADLEFPTLKDLLYWLAHLTTVEMDAIRYHILAHNDRLLRGNSVLFGFDILPRYI
jgi:hypothetical protein